MEMPQIVPAFGQANAHLAYDAEHDTNGFETVFLRPVLRRASDTALTAPVVVAATSSLLRWRDPVYIAAGFAGVIALALLLIQPLLAGGYLPGLRLRLGRHLHALVGAGLVAAVVVHVAALWLTSPPDVVDALLFYSPTPFSVWGVVAMWAVFATPVLAVLRGRLRMRLMVWRQCHFVLASVIVVGSVVHDHPFLVVLPCRVRLPDDRLHRRYCANRGAGWLHGRGHRCQGSVRRAHLLDRRPQVRG
jgi:hypothetical protein